MGEQPEQVEGAAHAGGALGAPDQLEQAGALHGGVTEELDPASRVGQQYVEFVQLR